MYLISKALLFIVLLVCILLIILVINDYYFEELFLEYRKSHNGNIYGIQEVFNDANEALNIIAKLHDNMNAFVKELKNKYPNDNRVKRLVKGFKNVKIEETTENKNDDETAFTINKGELLSLCLRKHITESRPFHDYNELCFVIIHELAHIASISEGHNNEFITNFKFLLTEAVNLNYYIPIDYSNNPFLYCGKIKVTNNPYF